MSNEIASGKDWVSGKKGRVRMWEIDAYFGSANRSLLSDFSIIQHSYNRHFHFIKKLVIIN